MSGRGYFLRWKGDEVLEHQRQKVAAVMVKIGLAVEAESKKELYKGHGVLTGTLRRSIHTASPGYSWAGDNVKPGEGTPERGGQMPLPGFEKDRAVIEVGSGLEYAMAVHQGHHSFEGYHYITNGRKKAMPKIKAIIEGMRR